MCKNIMDIEPKTIIIFVTAHEEYMPEAFGVYAFDYLVKPFKISRLIKTLERIKGLVPKNRMVTAQVSTKRKERLKAYGRNKEGISLVDMCEIILIQREDRNTVIYAKDERFTTSESLGSLEKGLTTSHSSGATNLYH